jgi:hypothetical protein
LAQRSSLGRKATRLSSGNLPEFTKDKRLAVRRRAAGVGERRAAFDL